jgi:hypothetical protein
MGRDPRRQQDRQTDRDQHRDRYLHPRLFVRHAAPGRADRSLRGAYRGAGVDQSLQVPQQAAEIVGRHRAESVVGVVGLARTATTGILVCHASRF